MSKFFRNGKRILALVFAAAILATSLFAGGITASACDVSKIDYWDGTLATSFAGGTGTEADPYIIATAEQLAYCCLGLNPSLSSNKYYKVADTVKTFVLQPENVVDLDTLLALENPEAVKNYFAGLEGKVNWISKFNGLSFNGQFDGNGATVYGLYATSEGTAREDVALFPQYDGGAQSGSKKITNTCKNIALKNSYLFSKRRLGGIVGAAYGTNYGAKFNGKVTVDSCAVVNCYMESNTAHSPSGTGNNWGYYLEQGVVACAGNLDIIVLKNVLVKDVYAYNTEAKANINIVGNGDATKKSGEYQNTVSDSIFLGTAPYGLTYFIAQIHEPHVYTNVVTDLPSGVINCGTPTWESKYAKKDYTDHIFSVTETGVAFKEAANMLDWKNTWFMGENGPELRVFHSELKLNTTHTTHKWVCDCCGLESAGGEAEHTFALVGATVVGDGSDVYMCTECEYVCQHNQQTVPEFDAGDCVTASGTYTRCNFCDWYYVGDVGAVSGHKLTYVAADIGDCEVEGHKEYWICSVCNNKFTSDDIMAPMNSAASDESLNTGFGPHIKAEDENGVIVLYDENGHWYKCSVNDGRLDHESNALPDDGFEKHKFKNTICVDCGYKCVNHSFEATGTVDVLHSCTNDEMSEVKCTRCGYKVSVMTKEASHTIVKVASKAPDDRLEGNREHYKCDVCNEIYADASGKSKITQASIIVPKVLPEEYRNMINADSGNVSPSTGDNGLVPALVMATLAGAALVVTRKRK